ncbi:MAG: hypothetical protein ACXWKA_14105, partial [Xanthobacteraceae bacterium]
GRVTRDRAVREHESVLRHKKLNTTAARKLIDRRQLSTDRPVRKIADKTYIYHKLPTVLRDVPNRTDLWSD